MASPDIDLSARLERLAAAVPVTHGRLDPVHRGAVAARQGVRMAWATPLILLVVVSLTALILGVGPFAGIVANSPVSATTRVGDFELTIRSAKSFYVAGEPIDVRASLTYLGTGDPIDIGHDIGDRDAPIGFGVVEPIFPGYLLIGGTSRLMCHRTTLSPSTPIEESFRKVGGGYGGNGWSFTEYMNDPVFWLDEGTWHPYAIAWFSTGPDPLTGCGAIDVKLRAEIEIKVGPRASSTRRFRE